MARPRKKLDPDLIERLAAIHCTMEEMAATLDCSVDTLERRFADVIQKGKAKGRASLRRMQWDKAQKGNLGAMIWLGKNVLGQKDSPEIVVPITTQGEVTKVYVAEWGGMNETADHTE